MKINFALMTMLSLGAAGLESGQAHAEEVSTSFSTTSIPISSKSYI